MTSSVIAFSKTLIIKENEVLSLQKKKWFTSNLTGLNAIIYALCDELNLTRPKELLNAFDDT